MKGRKPTPTFMKIVAGNPGRRPINHNEPDAGPMDAAPEHLSAVAQAEWRRMIDILGNAVLKASDRAALAMYCQAYGRWVEAEKEITTQGTVVKSPNGYPIQNPFLSVANKAMEQMTRLLPGMGLTPADRTRIHTQPEKAEDDEDKRMFG